MIECRGISRSFKTEYGEIIPVKNLDLTVNNGSFTAITGRSGSGKSTLLKMMGGLLRPTAGEILVDGRSLYERSEQELSNFRSGKIGFIFQDYLLEELYTVYQNLEIVLMIAEVPKMERKDKIQSVLEEVGMLHKEQALVKNLSGGEKQRVCIARAILNEPEILFADEPCGNLDYENGQVIMKLLRAQSNLGKTVVLITHNREDAKMTDRIVELKDGEIVRDETT